MACRRAAGVLPTGTTTGQATGTLVTYGYQYDAMGNPLQRAEDVGVSIHNNQNQVTTATARRARRKTVRPRAVRGGHGWPQACSLFQEHPTANDPFALDKTVQFIYDGWLLLAKSTQQSEIPTTPRVCICLGSFVAHVALARPLLLLWLFAAVASGRGLAWERPDWNPDAEAHLPQEEAGAWRAYLHAADRLRGDLGWGDCAKLFESVHREYPHSRYADASRELAVLLAQMEEEGTAADPEGDWHQLPVDAQVAYHIRRLRSTRYWFASTDYFPDVTVASYWTALAAATDGYSPVLELRKLGEKAFVPLALLLNDRRPTRSLHRPHPSVPECVVARHQDLAALILAGAVPEVLLSVPLGSPFSTLPRERRARVAERVQAWCADAQGKTELERMWLAVGLDRDLPIFALLDLLATIAQEPGQKESVLRFLGELWDHRHPVQRAQISWLMCRLGDTSKLKDVSRYYLGNLYGWSGKHGVELPDAVASGMDYALRQLILFGTREEKDGFWQALHGTPRVAVVGGNDWENAIGLDPVAEGDDDDDDDDDPESVRRALRVECYDMLTRIADAFSDDPFRRIPPEVTESDYPVHWLRTLADSREVLRSVSTDGGLTFHKERACDIALRAMAALDRAKARRAGAGEP